MNEYDTEIVKTILSEHHYTFTPEPEEAGVIFLNTCSVRENAHQKVQQRINNLKQLKRSKSELVLGVLGCMAQSLRRELLEENVGVDIVAGPDSYKKLPGMLARVEETGEKDAYLKLSEYETYSDIFPRPEGTINAWIAVMRGCDNFCTFCVVPYTRGRERSRDPFNVKDEVERLASQGFQQITLLGQNVNSYRYQDHDFADLIDIVSEVEGIRRIRFTSPHPKDFPIRLLETVARNPKACEHIHLPLQSGSNRILDMMNRTYTRENFLALVDTMRNMIPGLALTTDVIVGFPSETEAEFLETMDVMETVGFDSAFMFKYSERNHTLAKRRFNDDVSEAEKTSRITRLVELQRQMSLKRNVESVGNTYEVLVEGNSRKPNQLMGRNRGNKIIVFPENGAGPGDISHIRVLEATTNTLIGEPV